MGVGDARRGDDLVVRGARTAQGDVVLDGVVEEHRVLRHDAHVGAQALLRVFADRHAVDEYVARRGVVEPGYQLAERRFAAARGTHERHGFAAPDVERDAADHLACAIVGEVHVAQLDAVVQAVEGFRVGPVLDFGLRVEHGEDAFAGGDALVDGGELVDERAHGARDLREHGQESDEAAGVERAAHYEHAAEDEDDARGRDAQEFAHGRRQLLASHHRELETREVGVQRVELPADVIRGVVALDDLDARERLVEAAHHVAHALLAGARGVAQPLDDAADEQRHEGQEDDREDRQLPRNHEHGHQVADDEQRLAESDLERVGDAELHDHHVLRDARHDVALALVAQVAYVHADHLVEHAVAHLLERTRAQVLDGPGAQVAERVAQQARQHDRRGQQHEDVEYPEFRAEDAGVEVVDGLRESLLVDAEARRELVHGFEPVVGVEQRGEYGDNQHEVDRVEQGVEYGVEKVGYGIARNRAGETEQPHIGSEHCSRVLGWVYTMQRYEKSCANASALTFCCAAAAAAPPKREKGPENGGPLLTAPAVCDGGSQSAKQPVAAV